MILLDTHALLWLAGDDQRLTEALRQTFRQASHQYQLFLSPISLWEIALKHSRGKLTLDRPLRPWVRTVLKSSGVQLVPISAEIACECAELPAAFHGDPADRLIAATARVQAYRVATGDRTLLSLADQGFFQAIAL